MFPKLCQTFCTKSSYKKLFYLLHIYSMETKELQEVLEKTLKDTLPDVVEATVDAKMQEKVENLQKEIAELNKSVKFGLTSEDKENEDKAKKTMWAFFKALAKCHNDAEITNVKATYLNEWTDAEWGYMVPVEFAREVFRVAWIYGLVRRYARIIPMWTDTKDISAITNSIVVYWTAEWNAYTESKPTVWQIQLVAKKATALVSATNELIEDNMTDQEIWSLMSELIGEKMAEFEDANVLASSTQFTPLLADTNINEVVMGSWMTSFADITYDDLIDLIRAVPVKYKRNGQPRFIMSQDVVKYIEKLKDKNDQPIFYSTRSIRDGQLENYLLGYPLEVTDVMPWDTDDGVSKSFVLFGDLKHYAFGDRRQLTMSVWYMSGNWEKDIQSLKANERIAWKVIFPEAFSKLTTAAS